MGEVSMEASSAEEFVRLFSVSQHRILGFVHTFVPNLTEAEDILQETSVILWKKWPEFERDKDFVKWACGIARLEVFRMLRQRKLNGLYLDQTVLNQIADVAMADICDTKRLEDSASALDACIQELQESDRKILKLKYYTNMTIQQIAEKCNRPKSTIHDLLGKIRSKLLRCVRWRMRA